MQITNIINQSFLVDFLTNSIQNRITGDSFETKIILLEKEDIEKIQIDLDIQDDILEETMINNTNLEHYIIN